MAPCTLQTQRSLAINLERLSIHSSRARPNTGRRTFSNTGILQRPKLGAGRKTLLNWLNQRGKVFRRPLPGSTNYLSAYDAGGRLIRVVEAQKGTGDTKRSSQIQIDGDGEETEGDAQAAHNPVNENVPKESIEDLRPFPLNPNFVSEAVLSEPLRDEIYRRVVEQGQTVREVSIALSVSMERIGAVVRLKTIEQDWIRGGKPRATFYQRAVLDMLPQTHFNAKSNKHTRHESINDLAVHPATLNQLFYPTSESRHFTREDAGRAFRDDLLPADQRIPHPEMIEAAKDKLNGVPLGARQRAMQERLRLLDEKRKAQLQLQKAEEERRTTTVDGQRWQFRFKNISVDKIGSDGRGREAVGHRYGVPHEDRKKGQIKIPTRVE